MSAAVRSLTASPPVVSSGGTSRITVDLAPTQSVTITGTDESGSAATVQVTISADQLAFSTDPTQILGGKAPRNMVVFTVSPASAGTLAVNPDGRSLTFIAA